jgi:hypothetical protein
VVGNPAASQAELDTRAPVNTDLGTRSLYVGATAPSAPVNGDVWFDTLQYHVDWTAGWPNYTEVAVTNATNTYSLTTVQVPSDVVGDTLARPVGQIAHVSGAEGSDRRVYMLTDVPALDDIEVTALLYGRTAPQQGLALRIINPGDVVNQNFFAFWNDAVAGGLHNYWNIGTWKGGPGNFLNTGDLANYFEGLGPNVAVVSGSRTTNVNTLVLTGAHDFRVGDFINVKVADSTYNGVVQITAVTNETITYTKTGSDDVSSGVGFVSGITQRTFPHWIKARIIGSTAEMKAWKQSQAEPSWHDPRFVKRGTIANPPAGTGKVGIISGHLDSGELTQWGPITVTRASSGWKSRESGVWVPKDLNSIKY